MPKSKTPKILYRIRLNKGLITADPVQAEAVEQLEALHTIIQKNEGKGGFWSRITSKKRAVPPHTQGIYMHGGVGRGKSMLMDLFFETLPAKTTKRRVHFHEFMIETHDYLHTARSKGDSVDGILPDYAAYIAGQYDVLCFDEFHVTDVTDAMILGRLFTALFSLGVIVVATSNFTPDELYKGGLQRDRFLPFIQLLKTKTKIIHLDHNKDYREGGEINTSEKYLVPVNEMTKKTLHNTFEKTIGKTKPKPQTITVKGRDFEIAETADGAAWITFAQLCERPHGAEDYITIAETFDTIFIEGVRKMGYDRRNEAKRFMLLIDALYEAKTNLYLTADTIPEKLYTGHDHAFEFDRTISRLKEMARV